MEYQPPPKLRSIIRKERLEAFDNTTEVAKEASEERRNRALKTERCARHGWALCQEE